MLYGEAAFCRLHKFGVTAPHNWSRKVFEGIYFGITLKVRVVAVTSLKFQSY
jgi:hypothetical protein